MPSRDGSTAPSPQLLDQRVVAVAAAHALGRVELVAALELHAGDLLDDVDQLVDGDQLVAADVERLDDVALRPGVIVPSMQSSMYMKLRVCSPSPQISISCLPASLAAITLRQIAAGAFSRPPS